MKNMSVTLSTLVFVMVGCGAGVDDVDRTEARSDAVLARPAAEIAPPWSRPYGRTYGQWEVAWWQWAMRIPADRNPISDETGAHCAEGQSGPVWFLAGNYGGETHRECTVPHGKALYFPVANQIWVQTLQDDPTNTIPWMVDYVRTAIAGARLTAFIDGRPVADVARYREETRVFPLTFAIPNDWGFDATYCPPTRRGAVVCATAVDAGFALLVEPLPRGSHQIRFTASFENGFSLNVSYSLHVR